MMVEKDKLNATKDLLDCKDIKPWGAHTSFTNRAGNVVRHIRQTQGEVELCTTAWAKMYESIVTFDLLPESGTLLSGSAAVGRMEGGGPAVGTVHLCEAPGAFISATNHFIRSQRPEWHWEWIGNSLHPYYEGNDPAAMIDDDALIQATLQHWHWGHDGSGDIRRPENVAAICASAGAMAKDLGTGGAMLVTADGSIDCQENPNEQEMSTAALHYCEMVTALGVLSPGGSFILKAFTLFEHPTVCALHLMGALFQEVHVYKPATSKPGNSETYIIGKQFKGIDPDLHTFLVSQVGEDVYKDKALLALNCLPNDFVQSCTQCAAYFAGVQQQVISDNLATDSFLPPPHRAAINAAKQWLAAEWPRHFRLKPLTRDKFLAPHVFLSGSNNNTSNPVHKREKLDGTLAERVVLGKRRREQLGIQTASDRQHQQSLSPRSSIASGAFAGSGPKGLAVAAAPGALEHSGPGRSVGVAESMMQKWGYTEGMGLGKDLQGMAHKLDPTPNKGKAGLGLGQDHPQESFEIPKYNPQPDTAILTHDHASTRSVTAAISAAAPVPVTHSLPSYEALKPDLKPANLVIGSLSPLHCQPGQQAASTGGGASKGNLEGQTGGVNGQGLPLKGDSNGALGVMEAEYSREYRARLLWECAMALSCLQPGGAFVVQLPDCLTTFTVSMVYLLMRSFTGLSLVKPFTSCAATGAKFLVCLGRLDDGNVGALWLTEVMRHSGQLSSSGKIVAEFVPPSSYISSQLLAYLSRRNAALATLQTKALRYMKDQHNNSSSHDHATHGQRACPGQSS
ncbi:hypothetical protein WJX82_005654 [Trebouxia sp. C0006]